MNKELQELQQGEEIKNLDMSQEIIPWKVSEHTNSLHPGLKSPKVKQNVVQDFCTNEPKKIDFVRYSPSQLQMIRIQMQESGLLDTKPSVPLSLENALFGLKQNSLPGGKKTVKDSTHFVKATIEDLTKIVQLYDRRFHTAMYLVIDNYIVKGNGNTIELATRNTVGMAINYKKRKQAGELIWVQPLLKLNLPLMTRIQFVLDRRSLMEITDGSRFLPTNGMLTPIERKYLDEIDQKIIECKKVDSEKYIMSIVLDDVPHYGHGDCTLAARDNAILSGFDYLKFIYEKQYGSQQKGKENQIDILMNVIIKNGSREFYHTCVV